MKEKCGIFGCFNVPKASKVSFLGIHYLQHRGQDGAGIFSFFKQKFYKMKSVGLLNNVFADCNFEKDLPGKQAIAHNLYSILRQKQLCNVQPFYFQQDDLSFALAHNGNLINDKKIRNALLAQGVVFESTSDSELLGHLILKNKQRLFIDKLKESLNIIKGAYAFLILTADALYAIRDSHGNRPLSIGKLHEGYVVSSETCSFFPIEAELIRDVKPGEIVKISKKGIESFQFKNNVFEHIDAMEFVYFSRPDSVINGISVHDFRKKAGALLAKQEKNDNGFIVPADIVISIPDSSTSFGIGYANEAKKLHDVAIIKHKYWGRTFIEVTSKLREQGVRMKLSIVKSIVQDKRVILIDDSIVRGNTSKYIISLLKKAGAKEIHLRIASPMIKYPSFYGMSILTFEELIANQYPDLENLRKILNCDSLMFLSIDNFKNLFPNQQACFDIFTGEYPIKQDE